MLQFFYGMITMGFVVSGLLFFRFWWRTSDILFLAFGVAFCLFALNEALIGQLTVMDAMQSWRFLPRLAGFILIILAIIWKNIPDTRTHNGRDPD
jgi:hypothetical protein